MGTDNHGSSAGFAVVRIKRLLMAAWVTDFDDPSVGIDSVILSDMYGSFTN